MGDRATLAKARRELEELYLGVPDDSVNLTFQDFAQVSQNHVSSTAGKKKPSPPPPPSSKKIMDSISESSTPKHDHFTPSHTAKVPSLDFSIGLEASSAALHDNHYVKDSSPLVPLPPAYRHHYQPEEINGGHNLYDHGRTHTHSGGHAGLSPGEVGQHGYSHGGHDFYGGRSHGHGHGHGHHVMKGHGYGHHVNGMEKSMAYDDVSMMSGMSMTSMYQEKVGRRRPGIPHSNICAICSVYIYMFRNRCLVCGRVYCRQCLNIGMGEMSEGRKCVDCLGRKFSQRYIHKAGDVGCWSSCFKGYPSGVKIQELKWAEKGPRRSGERMHNRSIMMSDSRSPLGAPRTPNRTHLTSGPPSFVTTPEYSPYATPTRHHLPF